MHAGHSAQETWGGFDRIGSDPGAFGGRPNRNGQQFSRRSGGLLWAEVAPLATVVGLLTILVSKMVG